MSTTSESQDSPLAVVILAAGEGTRMKSSTPKVLQPLLGRPMLLRLIPTALELDPQVVVVVVGHGADEVRMAVAQQEYGDRVVFAVQSQQLGTGDAVAAAKDAVEAALPDGGSVMVLCGDSPLMRPETLAGLRGARQNNAAVVLTAKPEVADGYGRIVRDIGGYLVRIVEERDATPAEQAIEETNTGTYAFDCGLLFSTLERLTPENSQGEYYLTDVIGHLASAGERVAAQLAEDESETMGIDSREKLAIANGVLRDRIVHGWMAEGVSFLDPSSVWIDPEVRLARDVTILPGTMLQGNTTVAEGATVGPFTVVRDSVIGVGAIVQFAVVRDSEVGVGAELGPYCSLRANSLIGPGAKIGSFVETKNTRLGAGSKLPHLSYFGDATVGTGVNIGAGSITCNYDGVNKHQTNIEDDVFVGSDTMLIAPVTLRKGSATGAGSVVKGEVKPDVLVAGVPARKIRERRSSD